MNPTRLAFIRSTLCRHFGFFLIALGRKGFSNRRCESIKVSCSTIIEIKERNKKIMVENKAKKVKVVWKQKVSWKGGNLAKAGKKPKLRGNLIMFYFDLGLVF
ncbi:uncharacterized protein [Rutidosis leptorrhynchoides]|uniref:uncharacterized protein n=1 Tax=Rutidosis leptorrhynchoides TaxID=125765 RepID=UPI003A99DC75